MFAKRQGEEKQVEFWIERTRVAGFFDSVSQWLMRFVEHRIGDRRINRLVRKWLKAGVMISGGNLSQWEEKRGGEAS
jgi:RNA-directed DNA polymerase